MAREVLSGCVGVLGGGISESNTVNKQDGWGEREERNMEVLFITLVGEGDGQVCVAFKGFFCGMLYFF